MCWKSCMSDLSAANCDPTDVLKQMSFEIHESAFCQPNQGSLTLRTMSKQPQRLSAFAAHRLGGLSDAECSLPVQEVC